jgi:hypothetical protein
MGEKTFQLSPPILQIGFAHRLAELKASSLQPALIKVVGELDIAQLDRELAELAPANALRKLAALGLRGEVLLAAPMILEARPGLLTYYRTLLGYSQKEFYQAGTGLSLFRRAEEGGELSAVAKKNVPALCKALNRHAWALLQGLGDLAVDRGLLNELSLLSVGPQLRGGRNNVRGEEGVDAVYQLILKTVAHAKPITQGRFSRLTNASGREVEIKSAADPDIVIVERTSASAVRPRLAIEVKAGTDVSNIHNRIGEAEKSHIKAKQRRFTECWTIVNVEKLDPKIAIQQSPSTNRFFTLSELLRADSAEHAEFVASVVELTGISAKNAKKR